jgi:Protein of unknown function (DUF2442)
MHPDVTEVEVIPPYGLRLSFADGTTGFIDGARWVVGKTAGVFAALRDPAEFAKVFVEAGTIAWPNEIDIDPDTLYELAHASSESG